MNPNLIQLGCRIQRMVCGLQRIPAPCTENSLTYSRALLSELTHPHPCLCAGVCPASTPPALHTAGPQRRTGWRRKSLCEARGLPLQHCHSPPALSSGPAVRGRQHCPPLRWDGWAVPGMGRGGSGSRSRWCGDVHLPVGHGGLTVRTVGSTLPLLPAADGGVSQELGSRGTGLCPLPAPPATHVWVRRTCPGVDSMSECATCWRRSRNL